MRLFSFFTAGFADLVAQALAVDIPGSRAEYTDESAMLYIVSAKRIPKMQPVYFKNTFEVIAEADKGREIDKSIGQLVKAMDLRITPRLRKGAGFRTMISLDGSLKSVNAATKRNLDSSIAAATGGRVHPRGSVAEFWVIGRRDSKRIYLGRRLPQQKVEASPKGALDPQLAELLVLASRPHPLDRFLDPFAGSGSIPEARGRRPNRSVIASDVDISQLTSGAKSFEVNNVDARTLVAIDDNSIDVIVTDPPWGEFTSLSRDGLHELYNGFANAMQRVLSSEHGRFVILIAREHEGVMSKALQDRRLKVRDALPILVHGHPAVVLTGGTSKGVLKLPSVRRQMIS
jgi:Putative RNA methylase family UPF0020